MEIVSLDLGIKERFLLLNLLGTVTGNLAEQELLREVRQQLAFTEGEMKQFEIIEDTDHRMSWNPDKAEPKTIQMGPVAHGLIVQTLIMMDGSRALRDEHIDLFAVFPEAREGLRRG